MQGDAGRQLILRCHGLRARCRTPSQIFRGRRISREPFDESSARTSSDKSLKGQHMVQGHGQRGIDVLAPLGSSSSRSLAGQATPREALMQGSFKFAVSGSSRRFTTEGCNEALPNPMQDDSSKWLPCLDLAPPAMVRVNDGWMLLPPDPALKMIKPGSLLSSGGRALVLPRHATC